MEIIFPSARPHLVELMCVNPDSTVALDVYQYNRFFRIFVAFGVAVDSHPFNIPVVDFDGTHSRHIKYNGLILSQLDEMETG